MPCGVQIVQLHVIQNPRYNHYIVVKLLKYDWVYKKGAKISNGTSLHAVYSDCSVVEL